MFFCESCRVKNEWPQSFHRSRGPCEVCGNTNICYDVPPKFLPSPKKDVHTAHCCQLHGCKYHLTEENCTVLLHGGQEFMCSYCHEDIYENGGWEDARFANEMYNKGQQKAWNDIVMLSKGDWELKS